MEIKNMKKILVKKFKDENCLFTQSDIEIEKILDKYVIKIFGYEPFSFIMSFEKDKYFGYIVNIARYYKNEFDCEVAFVDSKQDYQIEEALLYLGYHIATRF